VQLDVDELVDIQLQPTDLNLVTPVHNIFAREELGGQV
jgi:hypothetical protein